MRPLRRPIAAVAAAAAAVVLSGCSDTNFSAQTSQQYQAAVGANVTGQVDVLNTLLVANPDGTATVTAGLVNHEETADAVTSVSAQDFEGGNLPVSQAEGDVPLPFNDLVLLGEEGTERTFVVGGATPVGLYVRLTVSFENAPDQVIKAPVVNRTEIYEDIAGR